MLDALCPSCDMPELFSVCMHIAKLSSSDYLMFDYVYWHNWFVDFYNTRDPNALLSAEPSVVHCVLQVITGEVDGVQ